MALARLGVYAFDLYVNTLPYTIVTSATICGASSGYYRESPSIAVSAMFFGGVGGATWPLWGFCVLTYGVGWGVRKGVDRVWSPQAHVKGL